MKPDQRKCEYSFITTKKETPPSIEFTPTALKWILAMVNCHHEEIGFLGIVNEIDNAYVITEIFYPKHCLVSSSTCEISPEGEIEIAQQLINENRAQDISKVRFWGHSHHTMSTMPSNQDNVQAIEKMNKCGSYFIRAIANKENEMSVSFFDYQRQIKFDNIKWSIALDYNSILSNIASIMNTESISKREKVLLIKDAASPLINLKDDEYKEIEKKVLKLKEKQLPQSNVKESSQGGIRNFSQYCPEFQYNIFNHPKYDIYNGLFDDDDDDDDDECIRKKNKKKNINQIQPLSTKSEILNA